MFDKLGDIYGHKFTSCYGEDPRAGAGPTWAKGLAGVTREQLAHGLNACITRNDDWPPTLPEFRALCLGVPSLAAVKAEMVKTGELRSGFVVLVWQYLDAYAFRQADQFAANRMVTEAYEVARERVMRGEAILGPVEAIAAPPRDDGRPKPGECGCAHRANPELACICHPAETGFTSVETLGLMARVDPRVAPAESCSHDFPTHRDLLSGQTLYAPCKRCGVRIEDLVGPESSRARAFGAKP